MAEHSGFPELIAARLVNRKGGKAFIEGAVSCSYADFADRVGKCVSLFRSLDLNSGDRIVLACEDDLDVAVIFTASLWSGIGLAMLDPDASVAEAVLLTHAADPRAVFMEEELAEKVLAASSETSETDPAVIKFSRRKMARGAFGLLRRREKAADDSHTYQDMVKSLKPNFSGFGPVAADATALILFTSGTTSQPKGVELTHRNLFAQFEAFRQQYQLDGSARLLNQLPLHHTDGLSLGLGLALFLDATWIRPTLLTARARGVQNLSEILNALVRLQATHYVTTPTILSLIARLPDDINDTFASSGFRYVISTAGPLDTQLWQDFERRFDVMVVNSYGLTETVSEAIYCGPSTESRRVGTIGKPFGCEAQVVDAGGAAVASGETGELVVRGDIVMKGYFRNPDATNAVFRDGWFLTGDLAQIDDDGFFRIVGRKKNVIVRAGTNVYPEDVTNAVLGTPGVLDAVTIGLPDPLLSERVVVCVLRDGKASIDAQAVTDHCRRVLSVEKQPNDILFFDDLPRGPAGKVELQKVKTLALQSLRADEPEAGGSISDRVFAIAASAFKVPVDTLSGASNDETTEGWNSLSHLEFILSLERNFGKKLSPRDVMNIATLNDAIRVVEGKASA